MSRIALFGLLAAFLAACAHVAPKVNTSLLGEDSRITTSVAPSVAGNSTIEGSVSVASATITGVQVAITAPAVTVFRPRVKRTTTCVQVVQTASATVTTTTTTTEKPSTSPLMWVIIAFVIVIGVWAFTKAIKL